MTLDRQGATRGPHRRFNPLLNEWVTVSPFRLGRPWQGQVETDDRNDVPPYDPDCYLCPGNLRANSERNPVYERTFAFDNDFPALLPPSGDEPVPVDDGLLRWRPQAGRCRVLCFSPRHDLTLARMDVASIRPVVDLWADEVTTLGGLDWVRYVQVFENKGAAMGCSNPHPHGQAWASGDVPDIPARKLAAQRAYFERHGRDLVGDYLDRELDEGDRFVCRNDHWVVVVPFWAVWPFETMVAPVRRVADLPSLSAPERDGLADIIRRLCVRYDNLFRCSFPYSMGWHGQPADGASHPYWRLHAVFCPPLLRSATIRKFLVGYELTAEPQRDLTAEAAAEQLRGQAETHYVQGSGDGRQATRKESGVRSQESGGTQSAIGNPQSAIRSRDGRRNR
ncbi:MAG: UDP-glucose--hexose-1-phosphate uridylyltransferase [Acidobacteriota bacterium]